MNPFYQKQCSTTPAQKPPQAIPGKKSAGRLTEVTPLDFLEAVYCNPNLPLATRLRAAIEASPYKHPKLSATAIATMDGKSFAETLERAIERSKSTVPLLNGSVEPLPASELKKPMAHFRRF
jgi:hypothetical protein